jgi:hypothetical protein
LKPAGNRRVRPERELHLKALFLGAEGGYQGRTLRLETRAGEFMAMASLSAYQGA